MKKFWTEYVTAFRHGMIKPGFKLGRWLAFTALALLALASWTAGIISLSMGYIPGATVLIIGFTFAFTSMTIVFMSSTEEHIQATRRNVERLRNLMS